LADQWEYKDVDFETGQTYLALLNRFGDEGWELVQIDHQREYAIFKRPKEEQSDKVTDDMPHRCPSMPTTRQAEVHLKYHSSATPNQCYHYLILEDRVVWIGYCPWCGDDI